jgi:hypothetical protein
MPSSRSREIPESERMKIIERWTAGWSAGTIAKELGRSRESIIGFVYRNGLRRGKIRPVVNLWAPPKSSPTTRHKPTPRPSAPSAPSAMVPLAHVATNGWRWRAPDGCAWIAGAPASALEGGFCNHRVVAGTSWCPVHLVAVYQPRRGNHADREHGSRRGNHTSRFSCG